jgi:hypothetical protein
MKRVGGFRGERPPDVVIATRRQVDILAILGLLFVESFLQKKLHCTAEVLDLLVPLLYPWRERERAKLRYHAVEVIC